MFSLCTKSLSFVLLGGVFGCGDFVNKASDASPVEEDGALPILDASLVDALSDANPSAADASLVDATQAPDAMLGFSVIETITVPVEGSSVVSTSSLSSASTYRLRVSGTFVILPPDQLADAEYRDFSNPPGSVKDIDAVSDQGVAIDDDVVDFSKTPNWGAYQDDHIYEIDFVGKDATISISVHDGIADNNTGSLSLEILQLLPQ